MRLHFAKELPYNHYNNLFKAKFKTVHIDKVDLARLRVSMFSSAYSCGFF